MKILFLDRDGTIIREPADYRIDSPLKLSFLPYVISSLAKLVQAGYTLVMVSNQDGLGTEALPTEAFEAPQQLMLNILAGEGIHFEAVFVDGHYPHDNHPNRKPGTGMLTSFLVNNPIDLTRSFVIGDRRTDAALAANIGCESITIKDPNSADGDLRCPEAPMMPTKLFTDWRDLTAYLLTQP